jgi:Family of unknown function (DUF6174)
MKKTFISSLLISLLTAILATQFSCVALQKNEFERNRRLWRESGVKNYQMTVDVEKTGHAAPIGKFIITVRDGVAKSIKNTKNVELISGIRGFDGLKTLDNIFDYIERTEEDTGIWDRRQIEYDEKFGYPKRVNLDKSGVLDDELYFEVLEFEILE